MEFKRQLSIPRGTAHGLSHPTRLSHPTWSLLLCLLVTAAQAQESSIFRRPPPQTQYQQELRLSDSSMIYHQLPPPRQIVKHDLVTIRVDKKAFTASEGEIQRRKTGLYDALLADWVALKGLLDLKAAPQADGDPRTRGQLNQLYRAQAELETREALAFDITAEVVDIRPNGLLVMEAHDSFRVNNEVWEYSLSGVCRPEDIDPGNVVLSKHISHLQVWKRERGHVRDSYRRGWFVRWLDTLNPF
jgi:flagellar L-ring protein FlgH